MRGWWLLLVGVLAVGCGIKGAPRPPLDEPTPAPRPLAAAPDAGCCGVKP